MCHRPKLRAASAHRWLCQRKCCWMYVVAHNICASLPLGNCITALYICDLWKQCPSYPPSNLLIYDLPRLYAFGWFTATLALIVVGHQHIAAGWIHTHKSSWWCWDCCSQQEKFEQKQTNKDSNWYAFRCLKATSAVLILWVVEANWCYNNLQSRNTAKLSFSANERSLRAM